MMPTTASTTTTILGTATQQQWQQPPQPHTHMLWLTKAWILNSEFGFLVLRSGRNLSGRQLEPLSSALSPLPSPPLSQWLSRDP